MELPHCRAVPATAGTTTATTAAAIAEAAHARQQPPSPVLSAVHYTSTVAPGKQERINKEYSVAPVHMCASMLPAKASMRPVTSAGSDARAFRCARTRHSAKVRSRWRCRAARRRTSSRASAGDRSSTSGSAAASGGHTLRSLRHCQRVMRRLAARSA